MFEWIEPNEEDERFILDPGFSEDQEPDPEFAGMSWQDIDDEIYEYEREREAYEAWAYETEWRHTQEWGY